MENQDYNYVSKCPSQFNHVSERDHLVANRLMEVYTNICLSKYIEVNIV